MLWYEIYDSTRIADVSCQTFPQAERRDFTGYEEHLCHFLDFSLSQPRDIFSLSARDFLFSLHYHRNLQEKLVLYNNTV